MGLQNRPLNYGVFFQNVATFSEFKCEEKRYYFFLLKLNQHHFFEIQKHKLHW